MMSMSAGLKEFADGDAALFNGSLLMDLNTQEDFEAEFHRILMEDDSALKPITINTPILVIPENVNSSSSNIVENKVDNYASPPETSIHVKFEEDPLSTVLNMKTSTIVNPQLHEPRKRGRPSVIRFKNIDYHPVQSHPKNRITTNPKIKKISNTSASMQHLQMRDRRSEYDEYSPIWIRGRGIEREGLCPICKPDVWFKIKQSAYWYHMNFYHGISAATGKPYTRPSSYRFTGIGKGFSKVEGHCHKCFDWIALSSEYAGTETAAAVEQSICFTSWYKHAQKCHHRTKDFHIPDEL